MIEFLDSRDGLWSPTTIKTARAKLNRMTKLGFEPKTLFTKLKQSNYSMYTIKQYFIIASHIDPAFKSFLSDNSFAFRNCYKEKTDVMTDADAAELLARASNDNDIFNALSLMIYGGLRISEVMAVRWEDFKDGYIKVLGKGNKQRLIPFNHTKFLRDVQVSGEVFVRRNNLPQTLRRIIASLRSGLSPHSLRAYYITKAALNKNLTIKDVALLAGHSSITTTARYIRSDLERIKQAVEG